jgi:light-regulated signal transduction histidine kinase (bacteriophytochrome)
MSTEHCCAQAENAALEQAKADLAAANKELEALAYAVSHDLRAPLRAIEGFTDVLNEDYQSKLDDEGKRYLSIVRNSSLKASRMLDALLAYSRLGRAELKISEVNTADLVQETINRLRVELNGRSISFDHPNLPNVHGDPTLLRELWQQLLSNAVKFTRHRPDARVNISGHEEGGRVHFTVSDNGAGLDMKYSDKLFQLFQRFHGESEFEGLGAGLAIVQRIVLRHGGKISAESTLGQGTTFHFTLPR